MRAVSGEARFRVLGFQIRGVPASRPRAGGAALRLLRALADRFKGHDQLRAAPPLGRAEPRPLTDSREGTPSLSVNLEMGSGVWFCHAGNVGGDSLSLVQHMEGLSSPREALAFAQERWPLPELTRADGARSRGY